MQSAKHTLILIFICFISTSQAQIPIASIIGKRGQQVFLKRRTENNWINAEINTRLSQGDSVKTGENSKVLILYFRGNNIMLAPNEVFYVQHEPKKQTLLTTIKQKFFEHETLHAGISRSIADKDEPPPLLYPRYGKILSNRPDFAWLSSDSNAVYKIKLVKDTGIICRVSGTKLWQVTTTDTLLQYPTNEIELTRGQNYWIELRQQTKPDLEAGCFTVVSEQEKKHVETVLKRIHQKYCLDKTENISEIIDAVSFLVSEDYYTKALTILLNALKKRPDNETIEIMLAFIFEEVGPTSLISRYIGVRNSGNAAKTTK